MAEFAAKEKTKENLTGIPMQLKERMEQRTGVSFDDVRVHYNSDMPARLGALAYTQGNLVEIGPGQESHLPHELGHVVQQKLGLVRANAMHPSGVAMNTEEGLERQADRIGAGGYIGKSPSGNAETDIVQRYVVIDNCTFAQAPANEDKQNRKVMVKNGEPAAIYFEQSVNRVFLPLYQLGIVKTRDYEDTDYGRFFRFAQRQISDVHSIPQSEGYDKMGIKKGQPERPPKEKQRAQAILGVQDRIIENLLLLVGKMRSGITGGEVGNISEEIKKATEQYTNLYQQQPEEDDIVYIALYSLGNDIALDILTLFSLAKRLQSDGSFQQVMHDVLIALEIMMEDLSYRKAQIKEEMKEEVVKNIPRLPTGCDVSAYYRFKLSSLQSCKASFKDIKFGGITKQDSLIHWEYHCATPVPLPGIIGPDDFLFIEDAVGKSTDGDEMANAHWGAHIYGRKEEEMPGWQANVAEIIGYKKLECRFNKLSQETRTQFFESNNFSGESKFIIKYEESKLSKEPVGGLEIVVRNNELQYRFIPVSQSFQTYMAHFLIDVAKTVTDEFVLQAFNMVKPSSETWQLYLKNNAGFTVLPKSKENSDERLKGVTIEHLNPNKYKDYF